MILHCETYPWPFFILFKFRKQMSDVELKCFCENILDHIYIFIGILTAVRIWVYIVTGLMKPF